ncbi:MAG: deoxyribodipyrimidine photolyase, partial [Bacteroidetes bacterium]|nr:deoxyribodipyrimidine photolyase [Bacteroidota bacterium]
MQNLFPAAYNEILVKIENIDPVAYGKSRNHIHGAVTRLSPYISRGVISTRQVLHSVLQRGYKLPQIESFVKELCWRDYFQRLLQNNPDLHQKAMYAEPKGFSRAGLPAALINGKTQITAIDRAIHNLYQQGHIHNHLRLYIASCICNIAKSKWQDGARWMYYYLKDADIASNFASWQWVSGASREKKYFANQSNINMFCFTQ